MPTSTCVLRQLDALQRQYNGGGHARRGGMGEPRCEGLTGKAFAAVRGGGEGISPDGRLRVPHDQ